MAPEAAMSICAPSSRGLEPYPFTSVATAVSPSFLSDNHLSINSSIDIFLSGKIFALLTRYYICVLNVNAPVYPARL
jgi:hypothetical protein